MKKALLPFCLLALLAALVSGCTNTSKLVSRGLKAEVTSIVRAPDGSVTASWRVTNDNIVAYIFNRVRAKIYLNGTYLGLLTNDTPLAIPANTMSVRSGKVTGGDPAARRALDAAVAQGSASYRVDSQVTICIYDDTFEESKLTAAGTVTVKAE